MPACLEFYYYKTFNSIESNFILDNLKWSVTQMKATVEEII